MCSTVAAWSIVVILCAAASLGFYHGCKGFPLSFILYMIVIHPLKGSHHIYTLYNYIFEIVLYTYSYLHDTSSIYAQYFNESKAFLTHRPNKHHSLVT